MATKKNTQRRHVPYMVIASLFAAGKSMAEIAHATRIKSEKADPTHYVRAILSGMRSRGFADPKHKGQRLKLDGKKLVVMTAKKTAKQQTKAVAGGK